jgi:hypothetical protein
MLNVCGLHRRFSTCTISSCCSSGRCSSVCPEVRERERNRTIVMPLVLGPFPDDAPRALHDKALQMYAIANINERTRKQDKYVDRARSINAKLMGERVYSLSSTVPPRLRLKLTAHICILSLHICRYTVDIDSLRLALGSSMALSK